jgi:CheY-like chemotaxis protein
MPHQQEESRRRVLVAEDNPQHLELIATYLEAMPEVEVLTAVNGMEALQAVQESMPDLVLLDIMMPKMSGFEVCKRIKSDPRTRDILVVMVTALNETGDVERAAECGTDDYLAKPVDRAALIDLIRNLLASRNKN